MKKIGFLVFAVLIIFTACNRDGRSIEGVFPVENVNPPGVFPICKEPITIRVAIPQNIYVEDYETNALTKYYEEKGNFKLEFEIFPSAIAEARQKIAVMVAGNVRLPEVLIGFGFDEATILNMAEEGAILPLNDYIENWGYYLPQQIEKLNNKMAYQWMYSADGNIYFLPWYQEQLGNNYALRGWINKSWLDRLGLGMPTTTGEFRSVLEAFAAQNPASLGIRNIIPAVGTIEVPRGKLVDFLLNAFIYNDTRDRLILDENGKVDVIYNKPEYREGLRYVAGLMQAGLILDQTFTIDQRGLRGIIESGEANSVGFMVAPLAGVIGPASLRRLEFAAMPPLTGPGGKKYAAYFPDTPVRSFVITKDARNPEAIFRWGDLMCSEEASIWARFGIPDVDYREPRPGEKSMYDEIGMPAVLAQVLPWGQVQNSHWFTTHAGLLPLGICDGQIASDNHLDNERWIAASTILNIGMESPNKIDHLVYTSSELAAINDIRNSLNSYVDENQAFFVMGQKNIDRDWDAYVRELDRIGLRRYLEIVQSGYERAIGK